jgi:hypothetical protein
MDFDDELAGNEAPPGLGGGLDRYASPDTIARHQSGNPDLYRQHNPAGRMNDLTGQGSGFGDGTGKASFGQRVRDFFDRFEPEEPGNDEHQDDEDNNKEQPAQESTLQEQPQQPYAGQGPAYAKSPPPPLGTHTVHAYTRNGPIRTPGTTGQATSYNVWDD